MSASQAAFAFFDAYLQLFSETVLKSTLIKSYILVDVMLAAARLVNELGGEVDTVLPALNSMETILASIKSVEQLQEQAYRIISVALTFRDNQPGSLHKNLIRQAKEPLRIAKTKGKVLVVLGCRFTLPP